MRTLTFIKWNTLSSRKLGHLHFYVILLKTMIIDLLCISRGNQTQFNLSGRHTLLNQARGCLRKIPEQQLRGRQPRQG